MKPSFDFDGLDGVLELPPEAQQPGNEATPIVPPPPARPRFTAPPAQRPAQAAKASPAPTEAPPPLLDIASNVEPEPSGEGPRWRFGGWLLASAFTLGCLALGAWQFRPGASQLPKVAPSSTPPAAAVVPEVPNAPADAPAEAHPQPDPAPPEAPLPRPQRFPARFAFNDATPVGLDRPALRTLVASLQSCGAIRVTGHSCDLGSTEARQHIAKERALAVRQLLVRAGLTATSIRVESAGSRAPVAPNEGLEGRRLNRRVEVECLPPGTDGAPPSWRSEHRETNETREGDTRTGARNG